MAVVFGAAVSASAATAKPSAPDDEPGQIIMPASSSSATAPTPAQLNQWLDELRTSSGDAQAHAAQQLIAAGDGAAAAVRRALEGPTTPQMRKRMHGVLARITKNDVLCGPRVTLKLHDAPLKTVLTRLAQCVHIQAQFPTGKSNVAPGTQPFLQNQLTINVQQQPFWRVMERIARITGVSPGLYNLNAAHMYFVRDGIIRKTTPVQIHGPLLLALQVRTSGIAVYGDWVSNKSLMANVGPITFKQVADDQGRVLLPAGTTGKIIWSNLNQGSRFHIPAHGTFICYQKLHWADDGATAIATVKGVIPLIVSIDPRTYHLKHLDAGTAAVNIHGMEISFGKPTATKGGWELPLTVANASWGEVGPLDMGFTKRLPSDGQGIDEPNIGNVIGFRDERGLPLDCRTSEKESNKGQLSYKVYIKDGKPASAWVRYYRKSVRLKIPFEFDHVRLPHGSSDG